jgi:hypothetical protein
MSIYPKEYLDTIIRNTVPSSCFVLMPFAKRFDSVYSAIQSACEQPELLMACTRADNLNKPGHIMEDILRGIVQSEYIIADLTGKNANVFYELGIAHSCNAASQVIIISQSIKDVPFDLRPMRCVHYTPDINGLRVLQHEIVRTMGGSAGEIFRFTVEHGGEHKSERHLSGKERKFYTFKIPQMWLSGTHAKFYIEVLRHVLGEAPALFGRQDFYLRVGESDNIKPTYSDIRVDRIDGLRANFSVLYRGELLHEKKAGG